MDKKRLKKLIKESFDSRHIGYRNFFTLDVKPDALPQPNTRPEQLDEGSDGNYMSKQNIESILKAAKIINDNISPGEEQHDWVEDKLSKVSENMRALRDFFENRNKKDNNNHEKDEDSPIVITKDMMKMLHEKGKCDCSGHKLVYKEDEKDIDEGIGISHTVKRGMNKKPNKNN